MLSAEGIELGAMDGEEPGLKLGDAKGWVEGYVSGVDGHHNRNHQSQ